MIYIYITLFFLIILINIYTLLLKYKIEKLEKIIINSFKERNNQIPFLVNLTNGKIVKHDEVFKELKELKQKDFSEDSFSIGLTKKIKTYEKIHKETDFIFKICERHKELLENPFYNYIKESKLEKSNLIGNNLAIYKNIISQYNKLLLISKIFIIGFILPLGDRKII